MDPLTSTRSEHTAARYGSRRFSVAPMMACTDRHARFLHRLLSRHALLYTEMVNAGAVLFGDSNRHLDFSAQEHPVALQLGGNNPKMMADAAALAEQWGYDEVNINCGCPSPRVKSGAFGAALMADPTTVADCVRAMRAVTSIPITVKTRIGIDDLDSYAFLKQFIDTVADGGCQSFTIHARKAWLNGLSPKENREVPPLHYDVVDALIRDYPSLEFVLNGGIASIEQACQHLTRVAGVMLGRAAYNQPHLLARVDREVFGQTDAAPNRAEVIAAYQIYLTEMHAEGVSLATLVRPLLGLFHGEPGARHWRRYISEHINQPAAAPYVIDGALEAMATASAHVPAAA